MSIFSMGRRRRRTTFGAAATALCLGLLLLAGSPSAVAKNDDGKCNGNCEADPAPAPMLGGSLAGLAVLVIGAGTLRHLRGRD